MWIIKTKKVLFYLETSPLFTICFEELISNHNFGTLFIYLFMNGDKQDIPSGGTHDAYLLNQGPLSTWYMFTNQTPKGRIDLL